MKEFYLISGSHKSENWEKNIQPYYDVESVAPKIVILSYCSHFEQIQLQI
jgi:hypothetical protein